MRTVLCFMERIDGSSEKIWLHMDIHMEYVL